MRPHSAAGRPVPAHSGNLGFLGENAASTWHRQDSDLAQRTGQRFKATYTLESKQGATMVSGGPGDPGAKAGPPSLGPIHTRFFPSTGGHSSPVSGTVT